MSWVYLFLAIGFEVAGTVCMKLSDGFSKITPSILLFVFYILSFYAITIAIKHIEISLAYAIWAGLGTAIISIIGILYFQESVTTLKMVSLSLVIIGVVGLNISGAGH